MAKEVDRMKFMLVSVMSYILGGLLRRFGWDGIARWFGRGWDWENERYLGELEWG